MGCGCITVTAAKPTARMETTCLSSLVAAAKLHQEKHITQPLCPEELQQRQNDAREELVSKQTECCLFLPGSSTMQLLGHHTNVVFHQLAPSLKENKMSLHEEDFNASQTPRCSDLSVYPHS